MESKPEKHPNPKPGWGNFFYGSDCPLCKKTSEVLLGMKNGKDMFLIRCRDCKLSTDWVEGKQAALDKWKKIPEDISPQESEGEPLHTMLAKPGEKKVSVIVAAGKIRKIYNLPEGWTYNVVTFGMQEDMQSLNDSLEEAGLTVGEKHFDY